MQNSSIQYHLRIIFSIVLIEYLLFLFSGTGFSALYGNSFFSLEADPVPWMFYLAGLPQFITSHQWTGILLDSFIVIMLIVFIRNPFNNRVALLLFLLLLLFYVTLMGHLAHHNYQFGFFMIFFPFIFSKEKNRYFGFEAVRYFMIFFYFSAAMLKYYYNGLTEPALLSHLVSGQFTPYFLEGNTGLRTGFNIFLAEHEQLSYFLYITSFLLEFVIVAGFFTKRFDQWLALIIIAFHFSNWFVMDIAPIGQVAFICLLFISKKFESREEMNSSI